MGRPIRILGIDPGLRRTGWGLIEVDGNRLIYVACGSVSTSDKLSLAEMQAVEPRITRGVYRVLTVEASVKARKSLGGTAPSNVVRAVKEARRRFLAPIKRSAR